MGIADLARFPVWSSINRGSCYYSLLYVHAEVGFLFGSSLDREKQCHFSFVCFGFISPVSTHRLGNNTFRALRSWTQSRSLGARGLSQIMCTTPSFILSFGRPEF